MASKISFDPKEVQTFGNLPVLVDSDLKELTGKINGRGPDELHYLAKHI